jgi:hypothetical protein
MSGSLRSRPNLRTQARLLQALGPYPDARLAVVAAMRQLDEQRQPERVPPVPVIEPAGSVFARKGGSGKLDEYLPMSSESQRGSGKPAVVPSLNHLVSGRDKIGWKRKAKGVCSTEIDDEVEL